MARLSSMSRLVPALGLMAASGVYAVATAAPAMASCPPDPVTVVHQTNVFTSAIGSAAGKHNTTKSTGTLSVSLSWTKSRSSTWEAGGSASVDFGIAKVEGSTSYSVTKTSAVNKTSTDTISVPAGYYGYAQPTVEYRTYHIYNEQTNGNCQGTTITHDYGYFDAITAIPRYNECVAKSPCTPY